MVHTLRAVLSAGLLAYGATAAWAQPAGQLSGVVRDPTGGVLPGVVVTVTGEGGLGTRTVVTSDEGRYELDGLPPGRYSVDASLIGFQSEATNVDIEGGPATLNLVLAVSPVLERVTVTATKTGTADIQSTPTAVTALPARTLGELGVQTVEGLAGFVPSLTVSHFAALAQVTIRGIAQTSCSSEATPAPRFTSMASTSHDRRWRTWIF